MNSISRAKQDLYNRCLLRLQYTNYEEERDQCREPDKAGSSESEISVPFLCGGGGRGARDVSTSREAIAGSVCGSGVADPVEAGCLQDGSHGGD